MSAVKVAPAAHQDNNVVAMMAPDRAEIERFVEWVHGAALHACGGTPPARGRLQVSTLNSDTEELEVAGRFQPGNPSHMKAMVENVEKNARKGLNVYVESRLIDVGVDPNRRGRDDQTVGVFALVVDLDVYHGDDTGKVIGAPSLIVASSDTGSVHRWYAFSELVPWKVAKEVGKRMRLAGGDSKTGTIAQPFRIAGTPNFPSAKKVREYGRKPSPTSIASMNEKRYSSIEFASLWPEIPPQAERRSGPTAADDRPAPETLEEIEALKNRLEPWIREKLEVDSEDTAKLTRGERSKHFVHVSGLLKMSGLGRAEALALWEAHPESAAKKYMDGRTDLPQRLEGIWDELDSPVDPSVYFEQPEEAAPTKRGGILDDDDGATAGRRDTTPQFEPWPDAAAPDWVQQMNRRHAIVSHKGNVFPVILDDDNAVSETTDRALRRLYAPSPVPAPGAGAKGGQRKGMMDRYDAWEAHRDRRFYSGWAFDPNGTSKRVLNRWRGFPRLKDEDLVDASGTGCRLILSHIREVVCAGNAEHADYLIHWLAHLVQRPGEKPGVAVILRGGKGCGKDTLGGYVGRILGSHYVVASQKKHVIGAFNKHLSTCLLLHMEELSWVRNKEDEGNFKALVTSEDSLKEGKGVDAEAGNPSFLRLLATSNEDWVVPATPGERRFFVLDVSNIRQQDHVYFAALAAEKNGAGPAALKKYLQAIDLTGFNVRKCPETEALTEQKLASLSGFDLYWSELLQDGGYHGSDGGSWEETTAVVSRGEFYSDYSRWCSARRFPAEHRNVVGRKVAGILKPFSQPTSTQPSAGNEKRDRSYVFPPLPQLRAASGLGG